VPRAPVWHDQKIGGTEGSPTLLVVTITVALAAVAVLGAIVVVAVGGGGQLSTEHPDHPPLALPGRRAVGGTDAALLRLPLGLWGYHKQITDEALQRFAHELTERDTRIAVLEQELAEVRQGRDGAGARRTPALPPARADVPGAPPDPMVTRTDVRPTRPADAAVEANARAGDPWKTIVDRPGDAEEEPGEEHEAAERPAERKDDGE
jgi:hypothetical protein